MNEEKKRLRQEQMRQQEQIIQKRKTICANNPEIGNFMHLKDKWVHLLLLLGFVLQIMQAFVIGTLQEMSLVWYLLYILGFWKYLLILILCTDTKMRGISLSVFFCGMMFLFSIMKSLQTVGYSFGNLISFYQQLYDLSPLATVSDILSWAYSIIVLITVLFLALAPKSRRLHRQFEELLNTQSPL